MFKQIPQMFSKMFLNESQYDKYPATSVENGMLIKGWDKILPGLSSEIRTGIVSIDCYRGL